MINSDFELDLDAAMDVAPDIEDTDDYADIEPDVSELQELQDFERADEYYGYYGED